MLMAASADLVRCSSPSSCSRFPLHPGRVPRARAGPQEAAMKYFLSAPSHRPSSSPALPSRTGRQHDPTHGIVSFLGTRRRGRPCSGWGGRVAVVGLGFKVAAVPFHMWTPDVYQGAPTPVTRLHGGRAKAAGFAASCASSFRRSGPSPRWHPLCGRLRCSRWSSGPRCHRAERREEMMAYSSVSHAGYILGGLGGHGRGVEGALFYCGIHILVIGASRLSPSCRARATSAISCRLLRMARPTVPWLPACFLHARHGGFPSHQLHGQRSRFSARRSRPSSIGWPSSAWSRA